MPFEFAFIHEALKRLSEDGRAVIVVPQGILKHATSHRFRQQLIDQDWLESVIGLPAGILLPYASVSLAVLVFRVNKEHRGAVRFIDASISTVSTQDRRQLLNVAQVLDLLKQSGDSQYVRLASHSQIAANGYDLLPYHYTTVLATSPDDANLAQFTKIIKTGVSEAPTPDTPTITIKKMRADDLRFEVNLNGLMPYSAVPESYRKGVYLTEPALLLTLSSTSLRPAWYPATDKTGLFVPRNIVALHLDTQKVDIAYLVTELNSSYVTQQIEYLVSGSVIPVITWSALEQLRVRLPSLLEQRAAVARQTSAKLDEQELV
ncbi:MAG: restriction endonuclease subunit M/S, partial [Hymenobacter sp.]